MKRLWSNPEYTGSEFVGGVRRGYRVWRLNIGTVPGPMLSSYSQAGGWSSAQTTARCLLQYAHASPSENCHCGIYAKYNLHRVQQEMHGPVYGAIDASGLIFEGSKGFRAQYATIRGLWLSHGFTHRDLAQARAVLEEIYRIPVFLSARELLEAFPPDADVAEDYDLLDTMPTPTMANTGRVTFGGGWGGADIGTSAYYARQIRIQQLHKNKTIDKNIDFKLPTGSD
jgi:hypothetical protein